MAKVKLAEVNEIPEGGMIMREHGVKQVLLTKIEGKVYAMNNVCTHEEAPLHEGELGPEEPWLLTCPWHNAQFDVRSGKVYQDTPWATDTEVYEVEVRGVEVYVEI
jgi:nitrite reductase/ring-hydroxylating ferredoxin subunit